MVLSRSSMGGKRIPGMQRGKAVIQKIFEIAKALTQDLKIIYVEDYNMHWARLLTSGVDLWLNTPQRMLSQYVTNAYRFR